MHVISKYELCMICWWTSVTMMHSRCDRIGFARFFLVADDSILPVFDGRCHCDRMIRINYYHVIFFWRFLTFLWTITDRMGDFYLQITVKRVERRHNIINKSALHFVYYTQYQPWHIIFNKHIRYIMVHEYIHVLPWCKLSYRCDIKYHALCPVHTVINSSHYEVCTYHPYPNNIPILMSNTQLLLHRLLCYLVWCCIYHLLNVCVRAHFKGNPFNVVDTDMRYDYYLRQQRWG